MSTQSAVAVGLLTASRRILQALAPPSDATPTNTVASPCESVSTSGGGARLADVAEAAERR